jgi:hypothetical protein
MPVTVDPTVATQLAQFGDAANEAASIKYNVPLPGAYSIQRVVPLELPQDLFNATSMKWGRITLPRTPVNVSRGRQAPLRRQCLDAVSGPDLTHRRSSRYPWCTLV